jgi:endogenous inhibitor of DNA gyrase (YacG/DUF329 family)
MTNPSTGRPCPVCGTTWQPDPRHPNRRYCSPRCKAIGWRRRTTGQPEHVTPSKTHQANGANATHGTAGAVANGAGIATSAPCPHCHRPISLITLLVPPAAAHVIAPTPPPYPTSGARHDR